MLLKLIVPLTLNWITAGVLVGCSEQSPPVVSVPGLFALSIASRKVQTPFPVVVAGSVRLLTIIAVDWIALAADLNKITVTGSSTSNSAAIKPGRTIARDARRLHAAARAYLSRARTGNCGKFLPLMTLSVCIHRRVAVWRIITRRRMRFRMPVRAFAGASPRTYELPLQTDSSFERCTLNLRRLR